VTPVTKSSARTIGALAAIVVVAFGLAACGGSNKSDHNMADVAFVQHMLPHHMHGVEMATLAIEKGSPQVKSLGQRIASKQKQEIATMQGYLSDWGAKPGPAAPTVKMTADEGQISKLKSETGKPFDRDFLMFMMGHHLSAIDMAQIEQTSGQGGNAKGLASSIVSKQEMEAAEMQRLLLTL
jgi:uncharacterized protein (DUF305 family)